MAKLLNGYADTLMASGKPIEKAEWLTAFLGKGYFPGDTKPTLAQETDQILKLRHALGEPMVRFNGIHLETTPQYALVRPEDYDSKRPETFFTFGIVQSAARYIGTVSCSVLQFWPTSRASMPSRHNTEVTTLEMLRVSRVRGTLSMDVFPQMFEDSIKGQNGFVVGLPAIREAGERHADVNSNALRDIESSVPALRDLVEDHLARALA